LNPAALIWSVTDFKRPCHACYGPRSRPAGALHDASGLDRRYLFCRGESPRRQSRRGNRTVARCHRGRIRLRRHIYVGHPTVVLVEALLARGTDTDLQDALWDDPQSIRSTAKLSNLPGMRRGVGTEAGGVLLPALRARLEWGNQPWRQAECEPVERVDENHADQVHKGPGGRSRDQAKRRNTASSLKARPEKQLHRLMSRSLPVGHRAEKSCTGHAWGIEVPACTREVL